MQEDIANKLQRHLTNVLCPVLWLKKPALNCCGHVDSAPPIFKFIICLKCLAPNYILTTFTAKIEMPVRVEEKKLV